VSAAARIELAHAAQADLFVSIHADAYHDTRARGATVYVLSQKGASDEAARRLAERENAADLMGGVSLADMDHMLAQVLLDLSQNAADQRQHFGR
jgi:N-acetylmuramoyl-L-alanine amidase